MRSLRAWGMGAAVAAVGACQLIAGVGDPKLVATGGSGGRGGGGGSGNAGGEGCMDATDTDAGCGGPTCPKCGPGQTCEVGSDCASGSCVDMTCAAMCTEENENDAGCGVSCPGCAIGQPCTTNADCASGVCESTTCVDYLVWAKRLGSVSGTDRTSLVGLGVDATGNAAFAANFNGQASFGGATYNTGSGFGMGFGRYDPLGSYIWDAAFVDQSNILNVERFNVTPSGDFAALGDFGGSGIDFGGGWQVSSHNPIANNIFVVGFSPSNTVISASSYGYSTDVTDFQGIAQDPSGNIIVAGQSSSHSYDLGSTTVNDNDLFVAWLGGVSWGHTFNENTGQPTGSFAR